MLVSEVINIVKSKALGRDNYNPDQELLILNFFNLAHFQLWDAIANLDDQYLITGSETLSRENTTITTENNIPIKARLSVFHEDGRALKQVSPKEKIERAGFFAQSRDYFYRVNAFTFAPTFSFGEDDTMVLSYLYVPTAAPLALNDELDNVYTEARLQYLLSDGTFYHLCFAEEGTRPTRQQDKSFVDWTSILVSEQASLLNAESFSTEGMW